MMRTDTSSGLSVSKTSMSRWISGSLDFGDETTNRFEILSGQTRPCCFDPGAAPPELDGEPPSPPEAPPPPGIEMPSGIPGGREPPPERDDLLAPALPG